MRKLSEKRPDPALLLAFYDRHARLLPWRARWGEKADPYRVFLSEIMLQQTTVVTVGPYFEKFVERWPRVQALAAASLDAVLQAWAGLGYYRRARGLHAAAQIVVRDYGGQFPDTEEALRALPGIGPYTAAAIAAIAFDQPATVVDGNVERVVARLFAVAEPLPHAKKILRAKAATLTPLKRAGDYAQALMDLGATVCTPRAPKCGLCPWRQTCAVAFLPEAETYPRRLPPKAKPLRRGIAYVAFDSKGAVYLRRRPDQGLFAGMSEVPSTAWETGSLPPLGKEAPFRAAWKTLPGVVRHSFTHFDLEMTVAVARVRTKPRLSRGKWVASLRWKDEALPSLMRKILSYAAPKEPGEKRS